MNYFTKPEMKITYFGKTDIITTSVNPPNYAANNMSRYMTGTTVKAIQTRTVAAKTIMEFNQ